MPPTTDPFQRLIEKEDTNQPQEEEAAKIERKAAWKTLIEWMGFKAKNASENLNIIARKQDEPIECEEADQTQEFLAPLFPEFDRFGGFVSNKAAFMIYIKDVMMATNVCMAYKHAWDVMRPHFDGSQAIPVLSLWIIELANCAECDRQEVKEQICLYGMKLVQSATTADYEEVMTPKLYCFFGKGGELKVMNTNEIHDGVQCGCGVKGCLAKLDNKDVNAKFISPQGMLQLEKGGEGNKLGEMSRDKEISMSFKVVSRHRTERSLKVARCQGTWPIEEHREMFNLLSMQSRNDSGSYFDYIEKMIGKEWKEDRNLVPNVEGHSAYFINHASKKEINELLHCGKKMDGTTRGMCYWARRSEMHRNLTRYKKLVNAKRIGDIDVPVRSGSRNGEEGIRTISFWKEFATVSKLLLKQIMSLRLSDKEKGKRLFEESKTNESMAIREERLEVVAEKLEMTRQRTDMQQKRRAAEELQGIFGEVEELMKNSISQLRSGASLLKKQKN